MKTLKELYRPFSPQNDEWNDKVILNRLRLNGKDELDVSGLFKQIPQKRIEHIISMYCMGRVLYDKSCAIKNAINKFIDTLDFCEANNYEAKFEFLWMLTALYHDVGYVYEEEHTFSLCQIQQKANYIYPFSENPCVPNCYTHDLLNAYLWFRFITSGKCDHGIAGAQKFYDDINAAAPGFRKRLPKVYDAVCLCIACHNVWFPNEHTICAYKVFCLSNLVKAYEKSENKKVREISLEEHPLLFLLSLADNLEPTKRSTTLDVLDNILFDITDNKITVGQRGMIDTKYMESVADLKEWLVLTKHSRIYNKVTVYLKSKEE